MRCCYRTILITILLSVIAWSSHAQSSKNKISEAKSNTADFADKIHFSGFARIVAGYFDESSTQYYNYENSVALGQESLFGLQTDIHFSDSWALSTQLLAHTSDQRESGVEWLYLNYTPTQNFRFKLGRLRSPFFRYSETNDVGFAYPWITLPHEVYGDFLFSNYEGVNATYLFTAGTSNIEIEAYYGSFNDKFSRLNETVQINVEEIQGFIVNVENGNLTVRFSSTFSSGITADVPVFTSFANTLALAGFLDNAAAFRVDGGLDVYRANISYDTLNYFIASEWSTNKSDLFVVPEAENYYVSAGYIFYPFQTHITFSSLKSVNNIIENSIPVGVSTQLDQLSFAYDQATQGLPVYSQTSVKVGLRWDLAYNTALKADVTFIKGEPGESGLYGIITDPTFDRKATFYQIALEWVF